MEMDLSRAVKLARIELTPEEEQRLAPQLGEVLQYVEKLNELDVSGVEPTAHATPLSNVMREDEPRESLSRKMPFGMRRRQPMAFLWFPRSSSNHGALPDDSSVA